MSDAELLLKDFQIEFVQFQDKLKSYLFRITANRLDAEDLVQETYIKASSNLLSFNGKSSLKTWVFTIATNLARDNLRAQRRWKEDAQDRCRENTRSSPQRVAVMRDIVSRSPAEAYEFKETYRFLLYLSRQKL